jgi:hypothetical protein
MQISALLLCLIFTRLYRVHLKQLFGIKVVALLHLELSTKYDRFLIICYVVEFWSMYLDIPISVMLQHIKNTNAVKIKNKTNNFVLGHYFYKLFEVDRTRPVQVDLEIK